MEFLKKFSPKTHTGRAYISLALCLVISIAVAAVFYVPPAERPVNMIKDVVSDSGAATVQISPVGKVGAVRVGYTYLRESPMIDSPLIATAEKGQEYKVLSEQGDWYLIDLTDTQCSIVTQGDVASAYIYGDYLKIDELEPEPLQSLPDPVDISDTKVGEALDELCQTNGAMGVGVAVIKNGQVAYTYEYGYMNKARRAEVVPDTKFRSASISKVITMMAAMSLEQKGMLGLESEITDYIGYPFRNPYFPGETLTTRHLLTHTGGLRDEEIVYNGSQENASLRTLMSQTRNFFQYIPGKTYSYSNSGFGVIGAIIEKITDLSYSDYTDSLFFDPLGMDASFSGASIKNTDLVADCYMASQGIRRTREQVLKTYKRRAPGEMYFIAHGNLIISAKDYASLITILINDGVYAGREFFTQDAIDKIHKVWFTDDEVNQCLALKYMENMYCGHNLYYHTGNAYGVLNFVCYDKEQKSGVVVMTSGAISYRDEYNVYSACSSIVKEAYSSLIDVAQPAL